MTALSATTTTTTKTLYERIGGQPAVDATVDEMYVRILGDPTLAPFFTDTDMVQQKQHQAIFLTIAFGGAKTDMDIGAYIRDKHGKSFANGLNETHFDAVAGHVVDSLKSLTVPDDLIDEVVGVVMPLRPIFETKK
jgi:hemoglobin